MPIGKDSIKKRVAKVAAPEEVAASEEVATPSELAAPAQGKTGKVGRPSAADEEALLIAALEFAIGRPSLSTAVLQRTFTIGYARAVKIMDRMEELGFIGPYAQGKGREVLITAEQLEAYKRGGASAIEKPAKPKEPAKPEEPVKPEELEESEEPSPAVEEPAAANVPSTAVMGNVAPETVEKVIGHAEGTPSGHVQIGSKMPNYLL